MRYLFLPLMLALGACDVKVKSDVPKVDPKPIACAREMSRDIPQAFQSLGVAVGAVRTEDCGTLVVGANPQGETLIAKYDANGAAQESFGERGVMKPLLGRYGNSGVRVQRLAVINNGYFAFGAYGRGSEPRSLFVFRFLDSGFLDLAYGPLRDGVARAPVDPRFALISVGVPNVTGETIVLRNRSEDLFSGTEIEREHSVLISGSQTMPKDIQPVPAACEVLNHSAVKQQTQVQISQSQCAELSFRTSGPLGSDALTVAANGTPYYSNFLGEMRWYYEGRTPVMVSRDSLGFLKKEYASFVQGQPSICGSQVDAGRRYLVFSTKTPQQPGWLMHCWYL